MTQTTPAPWIIRRFGTSHGGAAYVMDAIPDDEHGRCVANIIAGPNTNPNWEANAKLIAAAPLLLAACKRLIGDKCMSCDCGISDEVFEAMQAAIAAAEVKP